MESHQRRGRSMRASLLLLSVFGVSAFAPPAGEARPLPTPYLQSSAPPIMAKRCSIEGPEGQSFALFSEGSGATPSYEFDARNVEIPGKVNAAYSYIAGLKPFKAGIRFDAESAGQKNTPSLGGVYFTVIYVSLPYLDGDPNLDEMRYSITQNGKSIVTNKAFSIKRRFGPSFGSTKKNQVTIMVNSRVYGSSDTSNLFHQPKSVLASLNTEFKVMHLDNVVSTLTVKGADVIAAADMVEKNWKALTAAANARKCEPTSRFGALPSRN